MSQTKKDHVENIHLKKIRQLSGPFQRLFVGLFWAVPILNAAYWMFYNILPASAMAHNRIGLLVAEPPTVAIRLFAFLVMMASLSVLMITFWSLARIFQFYTEGRIFSLNTIHCYRRLGWLFILAAPVRVFTQAALSVVMTWNNPVGQKSLMVSIGSGEIFSILTGGVILVITYVMREARRLEEEQSLTI